MSELSPTLFWLELSYAGGLPPLEGPALTAERLLLLLHYGIDWNGGWVGKYRPTYWDKILPDRVIVGTFRNATLSAWWSDVAGDLQAAPRNAAERSELALLMAQDPLPVLQVMREQITALVVRVRITADAVRAHRAAAVAVA